MPVLLHAAVFCVTIGGNDFFPKIRDKTHRKCPLLHWPPQKLEFPEPFTLLSLAIEKTMKRRTAKKRRLSLQTLEGRHLLAASLGWDGPGLGDATLAYHIANSPASLSQSEVNAAIQTALDAWSAVADVTFLPTSQSGLRGSLDISFQNIDGPGGTLAQAYLPDDVNPARIAGDIEFDVAENWEIGNSRGRSAFDLVWVAAHEIGHALGLDHLNVPGSVLAPYVSPNTQFTSLTSTDIAAAGTLYAAADDSGAAAQANNETAVKETPDDTATETRDNDNSSIQRRFWRWFWRGWGRFAGRLQADVPEYHNLYNATDVNGDNNTTAADALMVINQLSQSPNGVEVESIEGMCDTNGDGTITAADALFVINTLIESGPAEQTNVIDESDTDTTDQSEEDVTIVIDTEDPNETAGDSDLDESANEADDDDINNTTEQQEQEVDDNELADAEDDASDEDDNRVDDIDDDEGEVDDDDEVDDEGDDDPEEDDEDCPHPDRHQHGRRGFGFMRLDAEGLLSRFDDNEDGSLSEDELPALLWERLVDRNVDADNNQLITLAEIETAIEAARDERFAAIDSNRDGLLQEQELSPRRWQKIIAADSDGDGAVSREELDTWISQRQMPQESNIDRLFAQLATMRIPRFRARF